ncbi:hypothetical protein A9Q80_05530 [Cycloclasticus sp. 46_83_sub15_T18]|nr:hypothetical protein A9Q80_05530 [Cycloclasticus sp. 46_83_sub15_T18]
MWEDYESYYVREDALKILKRSVTKVATECNIETRVLGGLLKFTPIGVYDKVLLELEQPSYGYETVIYKHRDSALTSEHKGKSVSKKWVIGFLKHNSIDAKRLIDEKKHNDSKSENAKKDNTQTPKSHLATAQIKEETNYGYSEGKSICRACNGDGGSAGQCYRCSGSGSGWA